MQISITNEESTLQLPVNLRQIRYGQYGLAQIIAEVPRYEIMVNGLIQHDQVLYIDLWDGLTRERARVDVVAILESTIQFTALGQIATLTDNNLYQRMWNHVGFDNWRNLNESSPFPPVIFAPAKFNLTDQRGLNITPVGGSTINFAEGAGYWFGLVPNGANLSGITFDLEAFLEQPIQVYIQFWDVAGTALVNVLVYNPAPPPGSATTDTFHILAPANSAYVAFFLYNNGGSWAVPFATDVMYGRMRNIQVVSSIENRVDTTLAVAFTASGASQVITPVSMQNIVVGMRLQLSPASDDTTRTSLGKTLFVTAVTSTTFTAVVPGSSTYLVGTKIQGFLVTPDEIIKDVVNFVQQPEFIPNTTFEATTTSIIKHAVMIGNESIPIGNTAKSIIERIVSTYSSDHSFGLSNFAYRFAVEGYFSSTYKAIVNKQTLSSRLSTIRTLAQTQYTTEAGVAVTTEIRAGFPNANDTNAFLYDKYRIALTDTASNDTSDEVIAVDLANSILRERFSIQITLTFTLTTLLLDSGVSLPLYWLRPNDKLLLGGTEFENIEVRVVGWTWNEGSESIQVEASAEESDIIRLLAQVA